MCWKCQSICKRVWEWGELMRKHRLTWKRWKDCGALVDIIFVTLCAKHDHVEKVKEVWNE